MPPPIRIGLGRTVMRRHLPCKRSEMSNLAFDPEETTQWEKTRPRTIAPEKWKQFEGYAAEMFSAFGMDLDTPGTRTTPTRFVRALFDATNGYEGDPKLLTGFPTECRGGPDCSIPQTIEGRRILLSVRASRAPVPRARLHRLHRS